MQKQQKQGLNVVSKVQMSILKNSEKKKKKKKAALIVDMRLTNTINQ